jgi:hypothetical protein
MEEIKTRIKSNRPNLAESSIKTYASNLKNIYYKVFGEGEININNFNKNNEIMKYLETSEPQKRKTILASLFILTNNPKYHEEMMKDIHHYNDNIKMQIKDPKQEAYFLNEEEMKETYNKQKEIGEHLLKKKHLTMDDLQLIQNYIIFSLYYLTIPRRSLDYTLMKIKNINQETDNYIEKNNFIFNKYKTSKYYNRQTEPIPKDLMKLLKKWITARERLVPEGRKINTNEYLLFDTNNNPLTPSKLTHRLNNIFGKRIGTSALRHIYITNKHQSFLKQNEEIKKDLEAMGSSMAQINQYLKK